MTGRRQPKAGHHLFWSLRDGRITHYFTGQPSPNLPGTEGLNIWKLRRSFPQLRDWLALERGLRLGQTRRKPAVDTLAWLHALEQPVDSPSTDMKRAVLTLLMLGPQKGLQALSRRVDNASGMLTPKFQAALRSLSGQFEQANDMTFLSCSPTIYLWLPSEPVDPQSVIVCFSTRSNSLNAPLPVAHAALARKKIALCYIFNSREHLSGQGLPGHDLATSAALLRQLLGRLGLTEIHGLGVSLGGHAACRYAAPLGLKRVLNFSGWADISTRTAAAPVGMPVSMAEATTAYPRERILSVLSKEHANDQWILKEYDKSGFVTPRYFLDSVTHGTFTAALIENRLDPLLDWLTGGPAPDGVVA